MRGKAIAAGLAFATLLGCGSTTAPDEVTAYDLRIELRRIHVIGTCEETPGNHGDFAYHVRGWVRRSSISETYETQNYPNGGLTYPEGAIVLADTNIRLSGIPVESKNEVYLTFSVTEDDPSGPDTWMDDRKEAVPVPFQTLSAPPDVSVTVKNLVWNNPDLYPVWDRCTLTLDFQAFWTPA